MKSINNLGETSPNNSNRQLYTYRHNKQMTHSPPLPHRYQDRMPRSLHQEYLAVGTPSHRPPAEVEVVAVPGARDPEAPAASPPLLPYPHHCRTRPHCLRPEEWSYRRPGRPRQTQRRRKRRRPLRLRRFHYCCGCLP